MGLSVVLLLPHSWESAAGLDTIIHAEKGNSEVCLSCCAPLEKGSQVAQADFELSLFCAARNQTQDFIHVKKKKKSILLTELRLSPCCVLKEESEFIIDLPPVSETASPTSQ